MVQVASSLQMQPFDSAGHEARLESELKKALSDHRAESLGHTPTSWREHAAAAAVGLGAVDTVAAAAVAAAEELVQAWGLAAAGGGPEEELGVGSHLMIVGFSACQAGFELGRERGSRRDW